MAKPVLTFLDYVSEAFNASPIIKGLGPMPVNKLACVGAFFLGFVNPGFWFTGAALEMGYLYFLSTDANFQKYAQGKRMNVVHQDKANRINAMIMSLDKESTDRLNSLNANLSEVNRFMDLDSTGSIEFIKDTKQKTLGQLPVLFLKLLVTKNLSNQSLKRTNTEELKVRIEELGRQLNDPNIGEALSRSVRSNLEIYEKRFENLKKAKENLQVIEMELNRIENQVQLVREEMALNRTPESITSSIDRINSTLGETEQWMDTHSEFFNRMSVDSPEAPRTHSIPQSVTPEESPPPPPPITEKQ